jgi:hypothetical protein
MCGICYTHGRDVKSVQSFGRKPLKRTGHSEDLCVCRMMIVNVLSRFVWVRIDISGVRLLLTLW